jgi:hypothetical protein
MGYPKSDQQTFLTIGCLCTPHIHLLHLSAVPLMCISLLFSWLIVVFSLIDFLLTKHVENGYPSLRTYRSAPEAQDVF